MKIINHLKKDAVLYIALVLAILSSIVIRPSFEVIVSAIDWRVLSLLFCLMAVVVSFRKYNVLDVIAVSLIRKCTNMRMLYITLLLLVFFVSMAVTNDVALLTFVPLTLIICTKADIEPVFLIILETLAANLGSCVTPMGNPQNLYLYSFYTMGSASFFSNTLLIGLPSLIMLICSVFFVTRKTKKTIAVTIQHISLESPVKIVLNTIVLVIILLSVFRIIDYKVSLVTTAVYLLICERTLFTKIDYSLLFTFIGFFIFTKNLSQISAISSFLRKMLGTEFSVYLSGIGVSQVISNVPAALLLSGFTSYSESLLLGVNTGGLGTLIASLASVISYKLYTADQALHPAVKSKHSYLAAFTFLNIIFLILLIPLVWVLKIILL